MEETSNESLLLNALFSGKRKENYERNQRFLNNGDPGIWQLIEFPLEISIELTNFCNLSCIMCPTPSMKRERGYMGKKLFQKVVDDLSREKGFLFLPQGFGEPLLHGEIFDFTGFAAEHGIKPIVLLSNGMLLHEACFSDLMNSIDILIVTIDGVTDLTYESVRVGGNLGTVIKNVERFLFTRGGCKHPHLVLRMIKMKETEDEISDFLDFWHERVRQTDMLQVSGYNDWTGNVKTGDNHVEIRKDRHPCRMLWKNLTVYHDGRVTPCCYDAEGELIVGNASQESLQNIWEGPRLKKLRDLHLACQFEQIPICNRCNSWF